MSDKLREAFERDVCKRYELKTEFVDGVGYTNVATVVAWEGFQAGHAHAMRERAAIAAEGEPVAWMDDGTTKSGSSTTSFRVVTDETKRGMPASVAEAYITPLYTRPSPAPMSEDEIVSLAKSVDLNLSPTPNGLYTVRGQTAQLINFARAIEARKART